MGNNRGSEWRKWDLHCHTPLDHEWINKPDLRTTIAKKNFAKEYIAFAVEQNLSVIAITDHNFCSSMDDLLISHIQEEAKRNNIGILPGFEITAKDGSGIHLLVIFNERTNLSKIHDVVKACFSPGTELCPSSAVPVSKLSISEIKDKVNSSQLDSIFIFAHADSKSGVLDKKTIDGTRRIEEWLNKDVAICQLSKAPNEFNDGTFLSQLLKGNNASYKREMTYIIASDCRKIDTNEQTNGRLHLGEKFVWIKADPTFEGLKQVIHEPNRVNISESNPSQKNHYQVIKEIKLRDNGELFGEQAIGLNQDLNSIIGGKSSGKSLLLYHLAKAVMSHEKFKTLSSSEGFQKYENLPEFELEATWGDGYVSKLSEHNNKRPIVYIPQMYLNYMAEKKSRNEDFKQTIDDILKSNDGYKEFIETKQNEILIFEQKIDGGIKNYFLQVDKLQDLERELHQLGDKEAIEKNIETLIEKLKHLTDNGDLTEAEGVRYSELHKNNKEIQEEIKKLQRKKELLNNLSEQIPQTKIKLSTFIEDEFSDIKAKYEDEEFKTIILNTVEHIKNRLDSSMSMYINETPFSGNEIDEKINFFNQKIAQNSLELEPLESKIKNLESLKFKQKELEGEQKKIEAINFKSIEIGKQKEKVNINTIIDLYKNLFNCYSLIVEKHIEYRNISESIDLLSEVSFNLDSFQRDFSDYITKNKTLETIFSQHGFKGNTFDFKEDKHIDNIKYMCKTILDSDSDISFNQRKEKEEIISALFKNYFDISYDLMQGNDRLGHMSPGKKGIILFQLFLHMSSSRDPILIDQPEDNLDNRTVYQELNDFIKEKKLQRQIIIVSHNSNLVVSTDSENVIVAHQNSNNGSQPKFEYINGALEDTFRCEEEENILKKQGIREHVCEILEGGVEAFKKREKRYNI